MNRSTLSLFILNLICLLSSEVNPARILGVFPTPSVSHQYVFRKYVDELVKRGHEVVTITPNPKYPDGGAPANLTEIDVSFSYKKMVGLLTNTDLKRGVITGVNGMSNSSYFKELIKIVVDEMNTPAVRKILEDKNQKFDLIVGEALLNYHLIVRKFIKAPIILFSSFLGFPESYQVMGAVGRHPTLYPHLFREKFRNMSFFDMLEALYLEVKLINTFLETDEAENKHLKENFGPDAPTVQELSKNIDLLFLNCHPLFGDNRPVPPSVVYLGALHMEPVKELPKDLKFYLDNSKRGVIYVSFGTNVHPALMDQDFLDAFLDAFKALPYDILWKFNGDSLKRIPENVKIQKWFPQRDMLVHPNIKLFVTQGGLQSTDEAIDAGVPLVGIAFLGDQWFNINKYVQLGIGVEVDAATMVAKDLIDAVNTVMKDKSYRENMKRLRGMMRDQPQTPMERAMWWTEHILRHGGGKHLRSPAANITWRQYLMMDTLAPLLAALIVFKILVVTVIYKVIRTVFKPSRKVKKS